MNVRIDVKPYLLIWDYEGAGGYLLVGPFETMNAAAAWAVDPAINPTDEPGWQIIQPSDPTKVTVLPPGPEARAAVRSVWPGTREPVTFLRHGKPATGAGVFPQDR